MAAIIAGLTGNAEGFPAAQVYGPGLVAQLWPNNKKVQAQYKVSHAVCIDDHSVRASFTAEP